MNTKTLLCCLFLSFGLLSSCKDDDNNNKNVPGTIENNQYVNQWIYENMDIYYYWRDKLPANPNYKQNPDKFFESICYWYDKSARPDGDRFSWIVSDYEELKNSLSGVSSNEIGFEYQLYGFQDGSVAGEILYVKRNTPAERQNLKRGQFFTAINGTKLTVLNYSDVLFSLSGNYTITLHDVNIDNNQTVKSLNTLSKYAENPVYLDTVYHIGGKNVGYLVYHFFSDDEGNGSLSYDYDLAQVFQKFSQQNVTDLILDLRYNSGGSLQSAVCLASMIVKNRHTTSVFLEGKYNDILTDYIRRQEGNEAFYSYFIDNMTPEAIGGVVPANFYLSNIGNNLQHFYILTGAYTASASEMIINGLKPYMDITLVGDTTYGKNVGSVTIYDKEHYSRNHWAIQPIITKLYNKNGQSDFTAGFIPDYLNRDEEVIPKKELGDINENMLNEALSRITGVTLRSGSLPKKISLPSVYSSFDRENRPRGAIIKEISK